ncbi:MAG TPA: NAD(P)/FAD-dependent oxidoreductase [Candidatus Sulfomarinibacteraceae bacterium]|nr:NAD(P)/FAD-dependent oxidoreductase [Candidatus Sulfomarinibacteraceae bacterium]
MDRKHVVIVGGGFGGLNAARALKDAPVRVTLIDRRNHHLFQPLLYQVATGALSPADIASPLRGLLKRQENSRVLLGEVVAFDAERRLVIMRDGAVNYDVLVVAAGADGHYFGNDHWEQWAPGLKTVEDALDIRGRILSAFELAERASDPQTIQALLTFVVVGGGPTGVELAGALAEIATKTMRDDFRNIDPADACVLLVQSPPRVLPGYPPLLSEKAEEALQKLGVTVYTGSRVVDVNAEGVTLSMEGEHTFIPAGTVLWAAGVKASPLGQALAEATGATLARGGRVVVEPDMSLPGHPDVFVVGDLAAFKGEDGELLPGVAQVAIQQGRYVGQRIKRRLQGQSSGPFRYRNPGSVATIGRNAGVADLGRIQFHGWLAWLIWLFIHLVYLVEMENRMLVFLQWAWNYLTYGRSARLITRADHQVHRARPLPAANRWQRAATEDGPAALAALQPAQEY